MKKLRKLSILTLITLMFFASCANDSSGSDDSGRTSGNTALASINGLKFDIKNAKALAATDSSSGGQSSGSARSAATDLQAALIKIMEDGSYKAAATYTGNGKLSKIQQIYKTEKSDAVYVLFKDTSMFWNEDGTCASLGQLVCVHSDGSIADILRKSDFDENRAYDGYYRIPYLYNDCDPVKFDGNGNAYIIMLDNDSNIYVLYKFSPDTNTLTRLTANASGTQYRNFIITSDGQMIIAEGCISGKNTSSYFLRAIPVSDPNHPKNIYYSSSSGGASWWYDDSNGICYCCYSKGSYSNGSYSNGLYKARRNGNTFYDAELIVELDGSPFNNEYGIDSYNWAPGFLNADGKVNATAVLNDLFNHCYNHCEKEFRLSNIQSTEYEDYSALISDKVDEEAIKWIDSSDELKTKFAEYLLSSGNLSTLVFIKGTNQTACKSFSGSYEQIRLSDYALEQNVKMFVTSDGLWKTSTYKSGSNNTNNTFYLVHMTDSDGCFINEGKSIPLPSGKMVEYQLYDGSIYMKYALLNASGAETGYHQIYSVNISDGTYKNLFDNVPNHSMLEVYSFSVGSNLLYYNAVRGTAYETGKVDVRTTEFDPLDIDVKLTAIYTF